MKTESKNLSGSPSCKTMCEKYDLNSFHIGRNNMSTISTVKTSNQSAPDYTGHRWVGKNYVRNLSTKEIAKILKNAIKPILPEGAKISITSEYRALNICLTAWSGDIFSEIYKEYFMNCGARLCFENWLVEHGYSRKNDMYIIAIVDLLKNIEELAKSYQQDSSDVMIDYFDSNFSLCVSVDSDLKMAAKKLWEI